MEDLANQLIVVKDENHRLIIKIEELQININHIKVDYEEILRVLEELGLLPDPRKIIEDLENAKKDVYDKLENAENYIIHLE